MATQKNDAAPAANERPEDEVAEVRRLLVARLVDGLKDPNSKASFLAVAQRFIANEKPQAPTQPLWTPPQAQPQAQPQRYTPAPIPPELLAALPFPVKTIAPEAGKPWPAMRLPFNDDDDDTAG
jgi:hypothetical protein